MKNIARILVVALFAIVIGEYLVLTLLLNVSFVDAISITGWIVAMISLILYIGDRYEIQPVFLKIHYEPVRNTPGRYLIEAHVSNEGAMDVRKSSCEILLTGVGIASTRLNRVIVKGPTGAIRAKPPYGEIPFIPLYPKKP